VGVGRRNENKLNYEVYSSVVNCDSILMYEK
jgi:hypothetical protein